MQRYFQLSRNYHVKSVFHFVWMLNSTYEKNVLWVSVTSEPMGYKHKLLQELNRLFKWVS